MIEEKRIIGKLNYSKALVFLTSYSYKTKTLCCKTKKFTGVKTVLLLKCSEYQEFKLNFKILNGKAKIVAVNKHKRIITLAEEDFNDVFKTDFQKGFYRIRLIGENADVQFELQKIGSVL